MIKNKLCKTCNEKITVIRRIQSGRFKGKIRVFSDKTHKLCGRCFRSERQRYLQFELNIKRNLTNEI